MKKILFILTAIAAMQFQPQAQNCHSAKEFSMFASSVDFIAKHPEPEKFTYTGEGEMIDFKTPDGKGGRAFLIKADEPTNNYLFVFHEWWGLNDHIKKEAKKFQDDLKDVHVLAIDLYDGKVTDNRDEAGKLMQQLQPERAEAIIQGAINHVGENSRIFTVGWCMGGGWSLQAALLAKNQAAGCVIYYGMPEKDLEKLKKLNCDVLGIFAANDEWISQDVVKEFEKNMQTAGKNLSITTYDNDHAFANPSNPQHDKEATQKAYDEVIRFFKARLK